ncbi:hypothetical protein E3N88_01184 [Mikania micrantha]|uniref:X8 domain-containing protein n=1 Tax=Mikania micrantha TaxID=192012 RepID=A0A5N6Q2J8_9ASTR|nr:hypothetical protein E3N88_01184 [Mikania micrantha]
MATFPNVAVILVVHLLISGNLTAATWCVARTDAGEDALQDALDYACGTRADCGPVQQSGPCFLQNTIRAHASYAFNSYYMHSSMDPAACDFAGTATVAKTDPSYGSCVYPASPSTMGGIRNPPLDNTLPPPQTSAPVDGSGGLLTPLPPGMSGATPNGSGGAFITPTGVAPVLDDSSSDAYSGFQMSGLLFLGMMFMFFLLMFQPTDVSVA